MVNAAEDYKWSSARAHLEGKDDRLVTVDPMLDRITNWQAFLDSDLDETTIETLRKHSKTGRPLGDDSFIETVESSAGKTF
ncbi:MAG: transposase, partial [Ghiorsea sp.]